MKVKDLLTKMKLENPEADVLPVYDEAGKLTLSVALPDPADESLLRSEEASAALGGHVERIEAIRQGFKTFYGLPVKFKIWPEGTSVKLVVLSPTGMVMVTAEIGIRYVVNEDKYGYSQDLNVPYDKAMREYPPAVVGYRCNIDKYVLTKDKLAEAIRALCEAPKWVEYEANRF
jgi:hypothetical protein